MYTQQKQVHSTRNRLWFPPQLKSIFLRVTIASAHTQANATWEPEDKKMQPQKGGCLLSAHVQAGGPAATLLLLPGVVYANQETLQKADRKWALKSLLGTMPANFETHGHSGLLQIDGKYVCERTMHGFLNKFWDTQVKLAVIPPFSNFLKCPPSHWKTKDTKENGQVFHGQGSLCANLKTWEWAPNQPSLRSSSKYNNIQDLFWGWE